jgi:uncharacterized protein (TIGR02391 family)
MSLASMIPDVDVLLALPPKELAFYVLQAARQSMGGNGLMHPQSLDNEIQGTAGRSDPYPRQRAPEIQTAVIEAWQWLENQLYIVKAPGINGQNGWRALGRRAKGMDTADQFRAFQLGQTFPKNLLHPVIAERCWIHVMRGEFEAAVFFAFKAVEVAVREAGSFQDTDIGRALMFKAFNPTNGPLTKDTDPESERDALMHLFAGAIGSYKNPHSHRYVAIRDAIEAQEMVMLASHLLRIVDSRGLTTQARGHDS